MSRTAMHHHAIGVFPATGQDTGASKAADVHENRLQGATHGESAFRPDLEALRGVAVLLVLLYHVGFTAIGGGYIGVDVFFVLSGYFMARTLVKTDRASILRFFDRRIRRVIPLTLVVAIVFMAVAPWLFLPHEAKAVASDFVGVMLMIPNLVYWTDVGYFARELFHPLLHYWSLGVEYQYYLLFPLLLMAFQRFRFVAPMVLVVSLVACIVLTSINPKTAFFMLPTRLWEFMSGWLAYRWVDQRRGPALPSGPALATGGIALGVVAACSIGYDGAMAYPGHWAILPTLAAFALIVAGASAPVLAGPVAAPLRYLGKISFSVYIVHYPLIFVAKYAPFYQWKVLPLTHKVGLLAASIVLAHMTHRWIEVPFRSSSRVPTRPFYTAIAGLAVLSIGLLAWDHQTGFQIARHDPAVQKITTSIQDRGSFRCGRLESLDLRYDTCELVAGEPGRPRILALGNSHVDSLKDMLVRETGLAGAALFMTKQNCLLGAGRKCQLDRTIAEIERRRITDIVFHAYVDEAFDYPGLEHLVESARSANVRVHVIDPIPRYSESVPARIYSARDEGARVLDGGIDREGYQRAYDTFLRRSRDLAERHPNVRTHATVDILCTPRCKIHDDFRLYYYDSNHLTRFGADQLTPVARTILADAISADRRAQAPH